MILNIANIKKSLRIIALAATLVLPLSCFNAVDGGVPFIPVVNPGEYGLNATVKSDASRTAIPAWPASPEYYVEYSKQSDWNDASKHTIKTPATDSSAFTLNGSGVVTNFYIPLASGTWVVETGVKNGTVKQLSAVKTVTLTPEAPVATETFFLQMPITADGKGNLELQVEVESGSGIGFVEMLIQCSNNTSITAAPSGTNPYTFTASNIPNGQQKIIINAYESADNTGRQIFSTTQDLIIYAGITTNQWLINGSVPTGNKYTITSQMVTDFIPRQYYVDSTLGSNSNSGATKEFPFQTISKAIEVIQARSETYEYTIHVKDGTTETRNEALTLTKSIKIECWKDVPNDMLGSATWTVTTTTMGITQAITIGTDTERPRFTIISANETCGLTINGNSGIRGCIKIYEGEFIMDGGKITGYGTDATQCAAVYLPNASITDLRRFTMKKGEISGNTANVASAVYVGPRTTFIMEGGKIINNTAVDIAHAVVNYGSLYLSGKVQIGGTPATDNTLESGGAKRNLLIVEDTITVSPAPVLNKIYLSGPLSSDALIGFSVDFGSVTLPTTTTPVVFTKNYTEGMSPSNFFIEDSDSYVVIRSQESTTVGEAAIAIGGGKIYTSKDFSFTFTPDSTTLTKNTSKNITITPAVTFRGTTLYFNNQDGKLYRDSAMTDAISSEATSWSVELAMNGAKLKNTYQPVGAVTYKNQYTIPGLPYDGTYTLTVIVTYMGFKYSASFNYTCS